MELYLIFKEVVELLLMRILGLYRSLFLIMRMHRQSRLEKIAEIRFLLDRNRCLDRFPALPPRGGIKKTASAAGPQVRKTLRAGIGSGWFPLNTGCPSAIPANQSRHKCNILVKSEFQSYAGREANGFSFSPSCFRVNSALAKLLHR